MDDFGRAGSWCSSHCNGHLWAAQCCWELNLCLQTYRRSYQWDYRFPYHLSWKVISSQPQSFAQGRKKPQNLWIPLRTLWKKCKRNYDDGTYNSVKPGGRAEWLRPALAKWPSAGLALRQSLQSWAWNEALSTNPTPLWNQPFEFFIIFLNSDIRAGN